MKRARFELTSLDPDFTPTCWWATARTVCRRPAEVQLVRWNVPAAVHPARKTGQPLVLPLCSLHAKRMLWDAVSFASTATREDRIRQEREAAEHARPPVEAAESQDGPHPQDARR